MFDSLPSHRQDSRLYRGQTCVDDTQSRLEDRVNLHRDDGVSHVTEVPSRDPDNAKKGKNADPI